MKTPIALAFCALSSVTAACSTTPISPSVWSNDEVREQLIATNLNHGTTSARGRLTRWRVPIDVNTGNIVRAEDALRRVEQWSGGVIRFTRVTGTPVNGFTFVEGGAAGEASGCVSLRDGSASDASTTFKLLWDGTSAILGTYTLHLGSTSCNDAVQGRYEAAYAEHALAHVLGVFEHFTGFTGDEGLVDGHAFAVLYNLYANPIGTTSQDLVIWPATVR